MKRNTIIFLALVIIAILVWGFWPEQEKYTGRVMSLEQYVSENISDISPVKEQLGGKFYLTGFEAADGRGTVSYEDGHSAYIADFSYRIGDNGGYVIESFTPREL